MEKLTQSEAVEIIRHAHIIAAEHKIRLGQAIFNLIPNRIVDQYKVFDEDGNFGFGEYFYKIDFFYEPNDDKAIERFMKFFVE